MQRHTDRALLRLSPDSSFTPSHLLPSFFLCRNSPPLCSVSASSQRPDGPTLSQTAYYDENNRPSTRIYSGAPSASDYASHVRTIAPKHLENDFKLAEQYGPLTGNSKGIITITMTKDVWREFSGEDAHSLFAGQEHLDQQRQNLRLLPITPNRIPDGRIVGALPIAEAAAVIL